MKIIQAICYDISVHNFHSHNNDKFCQGYVKSEYFHKGIYCSKSTRAKKNFIRIVGAHLLSEHSDVSKNNPNYFAQILLL